MSSRNKSKNKKSKIVWFARGEEIAKCGPFKTQIEATNAMRYAPGVSSQTLFPENVFVWPEEVKS